MKKTIFIFFAIVFIFSCKNKVKDIHDKKHLNSKILKKDTTYKDANNLPFGESTLVKYPFKEDIWYDDYKDKELQKITAAFFMLPIDKYKINNVPIIDIPSKKYRYYPLREKSKEFTEKSKRVDELYILKNSNSFSIYYAGANVINKGEDNYSWYILTLDSNNKFIDAIKFTDINYSKTTYSEMWKFCNLRLSYIDESKITTYDFQIKEWDMNWEYKLINKKTYKITDEGKIKEIK